MIAKFDVKAFRNMQHALEPLLYDKNDRPCFTYMRLDFTKYGVRASATNTFQASRFVIPCEVIGEPVTIWLKPVKIPAGTKEVVVSLAEDVATIWFDNREMIEQEQPANGSDFEFVFEHAMNTIDGYNHGAGQYFIVVNPVYLANALEGFKKANSVVLNFGSNQEAFTIRPYDVPEGSTMAVVYPIRATV